MRSALRCVFRRSPLSIRGWDGVGLGEQTCRTVTVGQMPPNPTLFTSDIVDSKSLRRRTEIWIDKTMYVLDRMRRVGYNRMGSAEAVEMVERMAERLSGMTVAYRHLLDSHTIVAYIDHLARMSGELLSPNRLLRTHPLLFSDLYSKAYVCVEEMAPPHIAQILRSYTVFEDHSKEILFKENPLRYPAKMDHVSFIRRLLKRYEATMEFASARQLLDALGSLHAIDASMAQISGRVFDRLVENVRIESTPLPMAARFLCCLGQWGINDDARRLEAMERLLVRIDAATDAEIKGLSAREISELLYGCGLLKRRQNSETLLRSRVWFDERFNGYSMSPRELARASYGYACTGAYDSDLIYLLTKQAYRRAGWFRHSDLKILMRSFEEMGVESGVLFEDQMLRDDQELFERLYGHR